MRLRKLSIIVIVMVFFLVGCKNNLPEADYIYNAELEDTITLEKTDISLSIDDISNMEEVKPEKPSGYYNYYNDIEGYHYYVIKGNLINPKRVEMKAEWIEAKAYIGNKEYEAKFIMENFAQSSFINDISVAEKTGYRIIVMVKDGEKQPDKIELYYNDNLKENIEGEKWNNCLVLKSEAR